MYMYITRSNVSNDVPYLLYVCCDCILGDIKTARGHLVVERPHVAREVWVRPGQTKDFNIDGKVNITTGSSVL